MNNSEEIKNKIITYETLKDIFYKLNDVFSYWINVYKNEEQKNKMVAYNYQRWSFKNTGSEFTFNVHFKDNSRMRFEKFENFIGILETRLEEIEGINTFLNLSYAVDDGNMHKLYHQTINLTMYENEVKIRANLDSNDRKLEEVYNYIREQINSSQDRYDDVIRNKNKIKLTTGIAIGFIPSIILSTLLILVASVKELFKESFVMYPVIVLFLTYFFGMIIGNSIFENLYKNINPKQKYIGYDSSNHRSMYKDDIDKYRDSSEVLIGKNINNIKDRKEIIDIYNKYKIFISKELIILLICSLIILFI